MAGDTFFNIKDLGIPIKRVNLFIGNNVEKNTFILRSIAESYLKLFKNWNKYGILLEDDEYVFNFSVRDPESGEQIIIQSMRLDLKPDFENCIKLLSFSRSFVYVMGRKDDKTFIIMDSPEIFFEPETTQILGESIGLYNDIQFFIATYNPYFLLSCIEKTHKDDLNVVLIYKLDSKTEIKALSEKEIEMVLSFADNVFFNLEKLL